jgi:hypothetical protein
VTAVVFTGALIDVHTALVVRLIPLIARARVQARVGVVAVRVIAGLHAALNRPIPTDAGDGLTIITTIILRQNIPVVTSLCLLTTDVVTTGASRPGRLTGLIAAPASVGVTVITDLIILYGAIPTGPRCRRAIGRAIIPTVGVAIVTGFDTFLHKAVTATRVLTGPPLTIGAPIHVAFVAVIAGFPLVHHGVPASREATIHSAGVGGLIGVRGASVTGFGLFDHTIAA